MLDVAQRTPSRAEPASRAAGVRPGAPTPCPPRSAAIAPSARADGLAASLQRVVAVGRPPARIHKKDVKPKRAGTGLTALNQLIADKSYTNWFASEADMYDWAQYGIPLPLVAPFSGKGSEKPLRKRQKRVEDRLAQGEATGQLTHHYEPLPHAMETTMGFHGNPGSPYLADELSEDELEDTLVKSQQKFPGKLTPPAAPGGDWSAKSHNYVIFRPELLLVANTPGKDHIRLVANLYVQEGAERTTAMWKSTAKTKRKKAIASGTPGAPKVREIGQFNTVPKALQATEQMAIDASNRTLLGTDDPQLTAHSEPGIIEYYKRNPDLYARMIDAALAASPPNPLGPFRPNTAYRVIFARATIVTSRDMCENCELQIDKFLDSGTIEAMGAPILALRPANGITLQLHTATATDLQHNFTVLGVAPYKTQEPFLEDGTLVPRMEMGALVTHRATQKAKRKRGTSEKATRVAVDLPVQFYASS